MDILNSMLEFVCKSFMVEKSEVPIDKSLIDEGIIDSFGLIEIAGFIEKEYGFEVKEEHMIRDNFGSLNKITDYINREKGNG